MTDDTQPEHGDAELDWPAVRLSRVKIARTILANTLDDLADVDPGAYAIVLRDILGDIGRRLPDGDNDPRDPGRSN